MSIPIIKRRMTPDTAILSVPMIEHQQPADCHLPQRKVETSMR